MESISALRAFSALAHETRLSMFRLMVQAGGLGLQPGRLSTILNVGSTAISFHLKELVNARLIDSRREGRTRFYFANTTTMNDLIAFLTERCCEGGQCLPLGLGVDGVTLTEIDLGERDLGDDALLAQEYELEAADHATARERQLSVETVR